MLAVADDARVYGTATMLMPSSWVALANNITRWRLSML
jgi:hypothetical protein